MEEIVFHHTLPIQLRFNDVDKFGHVNNTVYFSFYDLGKTEYFGSVCPGVDWEKIGIVVVHIEANFVKQIFASDHIAVQTAVSKIGTKSFHWCRRVSSSVGGNQSMLFANPVLHTCRSLLSIPWLVAWTHVFQD